MVLTRSRCLFVVVWKWRWWMGYAIQSGVLVIVLRKLSSDLRFTKYSNNCVKYFDCCSVRLGAIHVYVVTTIFSERR